MSISELTFFYRPIVFLPEVDSTNNFLKTDTSKEPLLVYTDFQTNGRGQYGRNWEAKRGESLLFSFQIFPENITLDKSFIYSQITALTLVNILSQVLKPHKVSIKWPNDIIVNDKKIAGILIENTIQGNNIQKLIVGVGINLSQIKFPDTFPNATSISMLFPELKFSCEELLRDLILNFEKDLIYPSFINITKLYNEHLYKFKLPIKIKKNNTILNVINLGVNEVGNWSLKNIITNEEYKIVSSREVEYVYS